MKTALNTNLGPPNENFMQLDGESSIFKQNLNTQSENYINLGMLINSLEKNPQAFWGSIDSFFYKTITPSDKNNIDTLIAQLSESSADDAVLEAKEKLRIEDIVNSEYLASMSNGQKSMHKKQTLLNEIDLVSSELEKTTKDQRILHIENVQQLLELKDRIIRDEDQHESIFGSKYSPLVYKLSDNQRLSNLQNSNQQIFSKASMQFQADFIRKLILELEDYQTAESIKYVIDCRKDGEKHEFCIIFDKSISDTETWIKEDLLDRFDKFREQSLFKIHAVPQKLYQSLNTFNITALFSCTQKQIHRRLDIKERPWKEVTIKSLGENPSSESNIFYKEQMQLKANQLELCHHCRYLFPKEFTFGCNYHSSSMGYLTSNSNQSTKDLLKDMEKNQSLNYMYTWDGEKNEYTCGRRYCASCLKSNYDVNIHHIKTDRHWLCPFCKGVCFCSRCLRNDQINKLIQLYLDIGGSPKAIIAESSLRNILWRTVKKAPKLSEDLFITIPRPILRVSAVKKKNSKKKNRHPTSDPGLLKKIKITPEKEKVLQRKKECQLNQNLSRSSRSKNKELSHCQEEPLLSYKKSLYKIPNSSSSLEIPSLSSLKLQSLKIGSNQELSKMHFQFEGFHENQK